MKYRVLSHSLIAATLLMASACNKTDIEAGSSNLSIRCKIDGIKETRASLVTTDNVATKYPTMTAYVVSTATKTQAFDAEDFATADAATSLTLQNSVWKEGEYALFSYPQNAISPVMENGKLKLTDSKIKFNYEIAKNSTDTPDIIVAGVTATRGAGVIELNYKHIFTAVNVIYKDPQIGHRVTSIKVKDAYTKGTCTCDMSGNIVWSGQNTKADLVDSGTRGATYANQVLTEDGCKFMVIPEPSTDDGKITIEVVVDGVTITKTSEQTSGPGDIVNFYIGDKFDLITTAGVKTSGKVEKSTDGTYKMTLESYVTGEMHQHVVYKSKPVDYVLILDYSGSMDKKYGDGKYNEAKRTTFSYNDWNKNNKKTYNWDGFNYDIHTFKTKNSTFSKNNSDIFWAYIEKDGQRYYLTPLGAVVKCNQTPTNNDKYLIGENGERIEPADGTSSTLWSTISYTNNVDAKTRITALQAAVSKFIDFVKEDANKNNIVHRVGIVKYGNDSYPKMSNALDNDQKNYDNPSYTSFSYFNSFIREDRQELYGSSTNQYTGEVTYQHGDRTSVLRHMSVVSTNNSADVLKASLKNIPYGGSTATDRGIHLGNVMMANQGRLSDPDVAKIVVLFSDGAPQNKGGSSTSAEKIVDANNAVLEAKKLKDAGYAVYTIGLFDSSESETSTQIMQAISSNYPSATTYTSPGTKANDKYFKDAQKDDLSDIFVQIAEESMEGEPDIDIHEDSYIKNIISDAFTLPTGYNTSGKINFYQVKQKSYDEATKVITWYTASEDITSQISCIDQGNQTFKISGFDYGAKFCGKGCNDRGYKLVMVFDGLVPNDDRIGTGTNETIVYTTGLYNNSEALSQIDPSGMTVEYD